MSLEAALKFLERMEKEETLRTQLYMSGVDTLKDLRQFAHGKGFVITLDDLQTALKTYKPKLKSGSIEPLKQLPQGDAE
jgi:predicted ribosomally synthesized peptide with nif11-like leader